MLTSPDQPILFIYIYSFIYTHTSFVNIYHFKAIQIKSMNSNKQVESFNEGVKLMAPYKCRKHYRVQLGALLQIRFLSAFLWASQKP